MRINTSYIMIGLIYILWSPLAALADNQVGYSLIWRDDGVIQEAIVDEQNITIKKEVQDWEAYATLPEKLPVNSTTKDYFILKILTLTKDQSQWQPESYVNLDEQGEHRLSIQVPGFILESTADEINDTIAIFDLNTFNRIEQNDLVLKAIVFDGLKLGASVFSVGFVIIVLVFANGIRKTNRFIKEEYSLEKAIQKIENNQKTEEF